MMSEDSSAPGIDNRPPMLEESDYESWKICIEERNAELEQETELLKTTLRNKEATIASLTSETKTVLSEKKTLKDKYLKEIVCLKNANQVTTGLSKLLNSQMSAKDRSGLGYGTQIPEGVLRYKNEVLENNPQQTLKGKSIVDSGCSRHMTGNKAYIVEYQDFNCGPIAFG
nr:hypothetical protein [Tanacetum cinerariifolium]